MSVPSKYCRCVKIPDARLPYPHLLYSSLTGHLTLIDDACRARLELDDHDNVLTPADGDDQTARVAYLEEREFLVSGPDAETARVLNLAQVIMKARRSSLQVLFLFSPGKRYSSKQVAVVKRMAAVFLELMEPYPADRYYLRFWLYESFHEKLLTVFLTTLNDLLAALPSEQQRPPLFCIVDTHGLKSFNARPLQSLSGGKTMVRIFIDQVFIRRCACVEDYLTKLFSTISLLSQQGLMMQLYFSVTKESVEFVMDTLLEKAMVQGLTSMVSRFFLCPVYPRQRTEDLYCELDAVDWELAEAIIVKISTNSKYRLFTLYGAGVITKFQNLLDEKQTLLPDIHHCPIIANSLTLTLDGQIHVCPKTCLPELAGLSPDVVEPVGQFHPELSLNEQELLRWWNRSVLTIPECLDCPDAFICGGGCALEALKKLGQVARAACQPVAQILATGVAHHYSHILRRFGPQERHQS